MEELEFPLSLSLYPSISLWLEEREHKSTAESSSRDLPPILDEENRSLGHLE